MTRTVIVGAGLGGLRAAQRVRELADDSHITIIGDETHRPYNRPPVSKELLTGMTSPADCIFPDALDNDFEWRLATTATGLDVVGKRIHTTTGSLEFDKLVIATGRRAHIPSNIAPRPNIHVLRGLDDAVTFAASARAARRVVVVGGGFIGCEAAATLTQAGIRTSVIEAAGSLMPALGELIGGFLTEVHRANGVDVRCDTTVTGFHGAPDVERVELSDGMVLDADMVLLALGSRGNTGWLESSSLGLVDGSVACDEFCFASGHPDIVAVGDVAAWTHRLLGRRVRVEHWSNAAEMGLHAAVGLVATEQATPYTPIPTFWSDQFDMKVKAAGFLSEVRRYRRAAASGENRWAWDGFGGSGLVAGVTVNDNKSFIAYRRKVAQSLTVLV